MNPNRRTFLLLAGATAASRPGRSQYVLPPQAVPPERFPPSAQEAAEIARRLTQLEERLTDLRKKNVPDESLGRNIFFVPSVAYQRIARLSDVGPCSAAHPIGQYSRGAYL